MHKVPVQEDGIWTQKPLYTFEGMDFDHECAVLRQRNDPVDKTHGVAGLNCEPTLRMLDQPRDFALVRPDEDSGASDRGLALIRLVGSLEGHRADHEVTIFTVKVVWDGWHTLSASRNARIEFGDRWFGLGGRLRRL
jgi:hypothetical protein